MGTDFSKRSTHKDRANFIYNKEFRDIIRISPHNSKLLRSSVSIKFGYAIRIADCHDIKDAIKSGADAFTILIPNFK